MVMCLLYIGTWELIVDMSAIMSSIATILLTFFIYRLTSRNSKKENYLRNMIDLYYKIEEDSIYLTMDNSETATLPNRNQAQRRIKVNSMLMIYYLLRIPCYYDGRWEFFRVLYNTSCHPEIVDNYDRIGDYFYKFCWELRDDKKTDHTFSFNYDGSPIIK